MKEKIKAIAELLISGNYWYCEAGGKTIIAAWDNSVILLFELK